MENRSISHNQKTANTRETLLWLVFSTLSTLLFPVFLQIGINQKFILLKYLFAVVLIVGFDLFVFFLSNYLNKLLTIGNKKQTKKEFYLQSSTILIAGIVLIFAFVFLKATSNNTNAYLFILALLPLEMYKNSRKLKQVNLIVLKIIKIILLLIYPLVFFNIKISTPLIVSFLAWLSLFSGKFISNLNYDNEKNKIKAFKLCIFTLMSSPLLFGFLVAIQTLPKIYTIVNLSVFFIVYLLNIKDIVNQPYEFKKYVNYFIYIQITLIIITSFFEI